ncbi:MAG: helix-turn-helix domain-containing protein [Bacteroidia bacterium]|nr:helix-turn-helix domain-containing protein [Bacteroidia bacterium]
MQDIVITTHQEIKEITERLERIENRLLSVTNQDQEEFLTTEETCALLKISKPTLHRRKMKGEIQFHRIGGMIRFKRSEVMEAATRAKVR